MFKKARLLSVAALFSLSMVGFAIPYSPTWAQDETPTPTEVVEASPTPMPTPTPEPTVAPEETAQPPVVIIVEPPPPVEPDPSPAPSPTDGAAAALVLLLALVGALNRFVEMLKPTIKMIGLSDAAYDAAVVGVSVVLGVVMVLVSNQSLNLFAGLPLVPPIIGTILTGAAAGFGAGAVQALFDLASGAMGTLPVAQRQTASRSVTIGSPTIQTKTAHPDELMPPDDLGG